MQPKTTTRTLEITRARITRSIDVDAARGSVDKEWTQFMCRTRVSVAVEFEGDESMVAAHLERDLKMLKAFAEAR